MDDLHLFVGELVGIRKLQQKIRLLCLNIETSKQDEGQTQNERKEAFHNYGFLLVMALAAKIMKV